MIETINELNEKVKSLEKLVNKALEEKKEEKRNVCKETFYLVVFTIIFSILFYIPFFLIINDVNNKISHLESLKKCLIDSGLAEYEMKPTERLILKKEIEKEKHYVENKSAIDYRF
jgi:uncharacterized membrane protein (DUF106 family)